MFAPFNNETANEKKFVCPDIDRYVTTLRSRLFLRLFFNVGLSLDCLFAKLFRTALPLATKYIASVALSTLNDWGACKDFKENVSQNLRFSA